jgi:hypothetical protein
VARSASLAPAATAERFGPLHASDHRTPYLSLLARIERFRPGDLDRAWLVERSLDRRSAMRGTLHLVPAPRLADVVCTFGGASPEDHRWLRDAGIEAAEAVRFRAAIEAVLDREAALELGALKRALPEALRARATEKTRVGPSVLAAVVRWMTEAGLLATTARRDPRTGTRADGWQRSPQAYERFEAAFGPLPPCDRDAADARLAAWYFAAHGPAAYEDWAWWTGLPAARSREAFRAVRSGLVEAGVDGWPELVYLPGAVASAGDPPGDAPPTVRLLPYEDAGIKAYRATRRRFFGNGAAERQQTVFGEVLPTILVDGLVVGTWASGAGGWAGALSAAAGRPDRGLAAELVAPLEPLAKEALDAELARVGEAIGAAARGVVRVDAPTGDR